VTGILEGIVEGDVLVCGGGDSNRRSKGVWWRDIGGWGGMRGEDVLERVFEDPYERY